MFQRCPLDQLVLHVKVLDLGEPKAILGLALSPPNLDDIERTILMLKQVRLSSDATRHHLVEVMNVSIQPAS